MAQITVKELAEELVTDARTTRKFLRSVTPVEDHPGKGSRWAIEKRQVRSLKSQFAKYQEALAKNDDNEENDEVEVDSDN